MEMSNKSLALILVISLIISLGGTLMSLTKISEIRQVKPLAPKMVTGLASGIVNLSIGSTASCNIDTNVSFGSGSPGGTLALSTNADYGGNVLGFENCSLSTSACYKGMQINNTGNADLLVNFTSDKNATGLLDATAPLNNFQYYLVNGTLKASAAPGCKNTTMPGNGTVNNTAAIMVCNNLSYVNGYDIVSIGFNLTVNETTPKTGVRTAAITVNCGQY